MLIISYKIFQMFRCSIEVYILNYIVLTPFSQVHLFIHKHYYNTWGKTIFHKSSNRKLLYNVIPFLTAITTNLIIAMKTETIEKLRDTTEVGNCKPNSLSNSWNQLLPWFWKIKTADKIVWINASPNCSVPANRGMCLDRTQPNPSTSNIPVYLEYWETNWKGSQSLCLSSSSPFLILSRALFTMIIGSIT